MPKRYTITICRGPECGDTHSSQELAGEFERQIAKAGLNDRVQFEWQSCFGRCTQARNVLVKELRQQPRTPTLAAQPRPPKSALYSCVALGEVERIVREHIAEGRRCKDMILKPSDPRRDGKE